MPEKCVVVDNVWCAQSIVLTSFCVDGSVLGCTTAAWLKNKDKQNIFIGVLIPVLGPMKHNR